MLLLVTLVERWLAALRSGVLEEDKAKEAQRGAERAVAGLRGYLDALHGDQPPPPGRPGSRLDPLRTRFAEQALAAWREWETGRTG